MDDIAENQRLESLFSDTSETLYRRALAGDALRYLYNKDGHSERAAEVAREVITLGTRFLDGGANKTKTLDVYHALGRAYTTLAPHDFHAYLMALEWNRPARSRFYQPRMKVLRPVVEVLTDMIVRDAYDVVLLSSPPRIGKSTLGLLFITWLIGRDPDEPILATGYAEKITKMFHDGLLEVYEDPTYAYRQIFPTLDLTNTSAKDLTLDFRNDGKKKVRKYKSVTCRAIDASLTGATEARQLLYCDDLVRDIEEALQPTRLLALREKMVTNLYSRKKEGCKELHIGTRWSVHDPIGWVEAQHEGNPRCKVIRIPALDEEGQSNFIYDYDVGFSTEFYEQVRKYEDDVTWECVYQQNPIERAGLLFPSDTLSYTYEIPDPKHNPPDDIYAFCDVAFGGADYLCLPIAYEWGDAPPVIADVVFMRGGYKETQPVVVGQLIAHNVRRAMFEANAGGDFYAKDVLAAVKETGHNIYLVSQRAPTDKSKQARIIQHSPAIKECTFIHPEAATPMYREFLQHLTTYTVSGRNPHDDAPDAMAGLAAMRRANLNATVKVFNREHI